MTDDSLTLSEIAIYRSLAKSHTDILAHWSKSRGLPLVLKNSHTRVGDSHSALLGVGELMGTPLPGNQGFHI